MRPLIESLELNGDVELYLKEAVENDKVEFLSTVLPSALFNNVSFALWSDKLGLPPKSDAFFRQWAKRFSAEKTCHVQMTNTD